jgi:hypothetical protein
MPANRKLKAERKAMRMWDQDYRTAIIADRCGVHPVTVVKWAHKNGKEVIYPYNREARLDRREVVSLRRRRMFGKPLFTHRDIAEILECSKSRITAILKEEGIP